MLQQTQIDRVIPFYQAWIKRFPHFLSLSKARFNQIYPLWKGLGYNRRALALQKLAQIVIYTHHGKLPHSVADLEALPGIGHYTARAVMIFAHNALLACIETNIRRAYIHHFFTKKKIVTDSEILKIAERALPPNKVREWHWALMDYGAWLATQTPNPNRRSKTYTKQSKFEGSLRQIRGGILKSLADGPKTKSQIAQHLNSHILKNTRIENTEIIIRALEKEGFINCKKKYYSLS